MTPQELSASHYESETKQQYDIIIAKLKGTLAKHQAAFSQLSVIEEILDVNFPETNTDEDYLNRLEEICTYLKELSADSYIMRHLHHYLCADVELVKYKTFFLLNQEDSYLILPR